MLRCPEIVLHVSTLAAVSLRMLLADGNLIPRFWSLHPPAPCRMRLFVVESNDPHQVFAVLTPAWNPGRTSAKSAFSLQREVLRVKMVDAEIAVLATARERTTVRVERY